MKIVILFVFFSSFSLWSEKISIKKQLEVHFTKSHQTHRYILANQGDRYSISFKDDKKKVQTRPLSPVLAKKIESEGVRILWENKYRNPTFFANCVSYVKIKTQNNKTTICAQNGAMVGRSFGFLNSLYKLFHEN